MMLALILVTAEILFGYALVSWAGIKAGTAERFLYSVVSGIMSGTWMLFILQIFLELNAVSIVATSIILFAAAFRRAGLSRLAGLVKVKKSNLSIIQKQAGKNKQLIAFFFVVLVILSFLNYTHNLEPKPDGLYSGRNNWGDLAGHLNVVTPFVENANKNLEYPDYAGMRMSYRFMFEFFTASLIAGGLPVREALLIPGIALSMTIFFLFYFLAKQMTGNKKIAAIALVIYTFAGGLGFIYFLQESASAAPQPYGMPDYTHYPDKQIFFSNQIATLILPQRSFLIGFPAAFIVIPILWRWFNRKAEKKELVFAALILGMLPFFHWHVFFSLAFVISLLFLMDMMHIFSLHGLRDAKKLNEWLLFLAVIAVISLPQMFFSISPLVGKIGKGFLEPLIGWMAKEQNWAVFWTFNLGVLFVLILPAFLLASRQLKKFYLAFFGLFVISNIFKFQPWEFDNLKIFYIWLPVNAVLVAALIHRIYGIKKTAAIVLVLLSVFSGILAVISEAKTSQRLYGYTEVELGKWVSENTEKDAVFLTYTGHDVFVPGLGGRKIFMGFEGWLWSRGIFDYGERADAIKTIYKGGDRALSLLSQYGIDYVVIGPTERAVYNANETFFDSSLRVVKDYSSYKIYRV